MRTAFLGSSDIVINFILVKPPRAYLYGRRLCQIGQKNVQLHTDSFTITVSYGFRTQNSDKSMVQKLLHKGCGGFSTPRTTVPMQKMIRLRFPLMPAYFAHNKTGNAISFVWSKGFN